MSLIAEKLNSSKLVQLSEVLIVFLAAWLIIQLLLPVAGGNQVAQMAVVWVANIAMLLLVWLGLYLRGQSWKDFGLAIEFTSRKALLRTFLYSLLVFVLAMAGFILGSIIMANITGIPESSDMSNYDYLKDNIGMLLLSLIGVYIVSSFGEEVIYRAFLITRLEVLFNSTRKARIIAVIISAVVFGFAHYSWGPMGIGQTAFMGLALAIAFVRLKRRLWVLILAHAYMDTILLVQLYVAGNS